MTNLLPFTLKFYEENPGASFPGRGQNQFAMLHPLGADQLIGKTFYLDSGAAHNDNLQAMMGVEVDMQRRDDGVVVRMLVLGQLVRKVTGVMIVKQGDRADRRGAVGLCDLVFNQGVANHVTDRFGSINVTLGGDHLVETVEQAWVYRYSEAGKFCHFVLAGVSCNRREIYCFLSCTG